MNTQTQITEVNEYQKQANDFLAVTNTEFSVKYLKTGKHFDDDKENRDIYEITLKRGNRSYTFNFGQSLNRSGKYIGHKHLCLNHFEKYIFSEVDYLKMKNKPGGNQTLKYYEIVPNKNFKEPTAYDVLACLQKYEVGTFENFCNEFGYDTDSRKAEKIYKAVVNEWQNIAMLFTDTEIEQLQEIN